MIDVGLLGEDDHVELIEGQIVWMTAQHTPHSNAVTRTTSLLVPLYGSTHFVRVQLPFDVGEASEPEPDFVVLRKVDLHADRQPDRADLIIEVADSSLDFDRSEKASLYARQGIADYWILNVVHRQVEVHRDPGPMAEAAFGHGYRSITFIPEDGTCMALFAPETIIRVAEMF
ncbi:MAG: Uma2 family endonuclease [Candidatus Xenobia bacterium]